MPIPTVVFSSERNGFSSYCIYFYLYRSSIEKVKISSHNTKGKIDDYERPGRGGDIDVDKENKSDIINSLNFIAEQNLRQKVTKSEELTTTKIKRDG